MATLKTHMLRQLPIKSKRAAFQALGCVLIASVLLSCVGKSKHFSKPIWYDELVAAIKMDDPDAVAEIYTKNSLAVDVALNVNASTALMVASSFGSRDVVKWLLDRGANVKASSVLADPEKPPGAAGFTALHIASGRNQVEIAGLLLECGADFNQVDENGNSPFIIACAKGHLEVIKFFIEHGADIELLNGFGWTPLLVATRQNQTKVAELLISQGGNINAEYPNGRNALMAAAELGNELLVRLLIEKGADVNHSNADGKTALMDAAAEGRSEVVRLLIQNGAKVDQQSEEGWTALIKAAAHGHCETVRILCEAGANPSFTNNFSHTAFDYARGLTGANVLTKDSDLTPLIDNGSISRDDLYYVMVRLGGDGDYDCVLRVLDEHRRRVRDNPTSK